MTVFSTIFLILSYFLIFYAAYNAFLMLVGLFFHKQKYPMIEDKSKFCIFVPCHNEGDVILATIKNYLNINYDKNLYDIYFIADNCSDKTADIMRKTINELNKDSNFYVMERNVPDLNKRGKPHAIRWGIDQLEAKDEFYNKYDMFMILDADNFVDPDILKHVNSQFYSYKENKRPSLIQTYLDSKNKDNIISRGYFAGYRISNGFWQFSKHQLGLNPAIGGTGFAITTEFLKESGGYNCSSLTEDLEIQTIATLKGKKIVYNHNTRIYDEKPTSLKVSCVQKTRWAQGHWFVCFKFAFKLLISMFNPKEIKLFFRKLDNILYLLSMFNIMLAVILFATRIICLIIGVPLVYSAVLDITSICAFIISVLIIPISSLIDGKSEEKKKVLAEIIPNYIAIVISSFVFIYASIVGLLKSRNQKVWAKTAHKVNSVYLDKVNKAGEFKKQGEKIKVMTIFGTRPEAIKMSPLVIELKNRPEIETIVCVTAQHREMLDQVLEIFKITPDYDLNIMKQSQTLSMITAYVLTGIEEIILKEKPDIVLVHGDTTTSFASALAGFYSKTKIGHVEAGLRTYNLQSPFPEEANRVFVDDMCDLYFAPTKDSKKNLLNEHKNTAGIFVTGNTAIDALKYTITDTYKNEVLDWAKGSKLVLLTAHRRENWGEPMRNIFRAINRITAENKDIKVVYPVHLNPIVREIANEMFGTNEQVKLVEPFNVIDFHNIMSHSYLILTDSGGIQEEAPSLGKPVLVLRDTTERPEGIKAGTLKLAGIKEEKVYKAIKKLLHNKRQYNKMSKAKNPYGNGDTSKQIVDIITKLYN